MEGFGEATAARLGGGGARRSTLAGMFGPRAEAGAGLAAGGRSRGGQTQLGGGGGSEAVGCELEGGVLRGLAAEWGERDARVVPEQRPIWILSAWRSPPMI